ncbi:hypothetical protein [Maricaulis sp.]|uniref:hypothetical protein n=1 Tax=Maricaulis sp. TaxID=1486257 RepID=UPI0026367153|nr:hypothetical protein [Maricaulis sp.]
MRWAGFVLAIAAFLCGCATPQYNQTVDVEQYSNPPLGVVATVRVGDEMLAQGNIQRQQGISVSPGTTVSGYTFHGGFYIQTGFDDEWTYHSFALGPRGAVAAPGGTAFLGAGAFMDPPMSIRAGKAEQRLCVITVFNLASCRDRGFERSTRSVSSENSFQQTLIYSGRIGNRINISYRESTGNMARPAFTNDVEYDLNESSIIGYRGAELRVIDATNTSITYEVIRNFNTP